MPVTIKKDFSDLKKLKLNIAKISNSTIEWGFFEEDRYGPENRNLPVASVAAINEFGWGRNPERSFFRDSIEEISKRLSKLIAPVFTNVIAGKPYQSAMEVLGEALRQSVKDKIEQWFDTLNSAGWTKFKARVGAPTKPLEYTQTMVDSVRFKLLRRGK